MSMLLTLAMGTGVQEECGNELRLVHWEESSKRPNKLRRAWLGPSNFKESG